MRCCSPHRHPGARHDRGLTLVEVVVGGFILSLSALALAATLASTSALPDSLHEQYVALNGLEVKANELLAVPFDRLAADYDGTGFAVPGLRSLDGDADGLPGEIHFDAASGSETTRFLTLSIRWQGAAGPRSLSVTRCIANVRGEATPSYPTTQDTDPTLTYANGASDTDPTYVDPTYAYPTDG